MVLIFVEYQWETSLVLDIALSEAVGSLKAHVQAITGKPIEQQRLQHIDDDDMCKLLPRYDSPELQDEKSLEFYGIAEGTILFLSHRHQTPVLYFMTLTGKNMMCDVALDWSVSMLKDIIWDKEGTPSDQQRLIFGARQLEDDRTLSSYGIQSEDIIHIVLRLRGGGPGETLAYAVVCHDWDGNMFSVVEGLKPIRGNAVVISEMVDKNWYRGRVPGERGDRVFPSSYVKIQRYLDPGFQAAAPGYYRAKQGAMLVYNEKADAESVVTNIQLDESKPTPPLPAFNYETAPSFFKCDIANEGSSFVSVTFTPNQLVIPGDAVRVNVKLLCLTHDPRLRITSISLRIVVPDNEVRSVEPRELLFGEDVVVMHGTDGANRDRAAELKPWTAVRGGTGGTKETITQRSGEEAISYGIRGDLDRNNAVWSIKANGAQGIHGNVEHLSFTLGRQPREILWVYSVSAMMDGESKPIIRRVRSGAPSWIRGIGKGRWLSFLRQFGF